MIEKVAVIVMAFISMGFLFGCGGSKSALDGRQQKTDRT